MDLATYIIRGREKISKYILSYSSYLTMYPAPLVAIGTASSPVPMLPFNKRMRVSKSLEKEREGGKRDN